MTKKKRKELHGTVKKLIRPMFLGGKEKAEIEIREADDLYREIRVDNELWDEKGRKTSLKSGAEVDIVLEADSNATLKAPE